MATMFNVAIGIGILFADTIGVTITGVRRWRIMVAIAALPASFVFVSMFFLPHNPRGAPHFAARDAGSCRIVLIKTT